MKFRLLSLMLSATWLPSATFADEAPCAQIGIQPSPPGGGVARDANGLLQIEYAHAGGHPTTTWAWYNDTWHHEHPDEKQPPPPENHDSHGWLQDSHGQVDTKDAMRGRYPIKDTESFLSRGPGKVFSVMWTGFSDAGQHNPLIGFHKDCTKYETSMCWGNGWDFPAFCINIRWDTPYPYQGLPDRKLSLTELMKTKLVKP